MRQSTTVSIASCLLLVSGVALLSRAAAADVATAQAEDGRLTAEAVKKLKNPVPFAKASLTRGRILYLRECTECHGADGKSLVDVIANATDLTEPKLWKSGTSDGEIFRSIRDGAGDAMPPFSEKFDKPEDMWHLVNYVRSLWPEAAKPRLEESPAN